MKNKSILLVFSFCAISMLIGSCSIVRKVNMKRSFIEINYGLIKSTQNSHEKNSEAASGKTILGYSNGVYETTTEVPLRPHIQFGFEFQINSKSTKPVNVDIVLTYPQSIENENGQIFDNYKTRREITPNEKTWTAYVLNKEYELIAGKWLYEVFYRGKLIYSKEFNVE